MSQGIGGLEQKALGGRDLGTFLNEIADPQYVDESKKIKGTGSAEIDRDAFFKMMLAQLKNQDPTTPLKSHEIASQLATFSSLEQMTNMNDTLTDLKKAQQPVTELQSLSLIGKKVSGDSGRIMRGPEDSQHDLTFTLTDDAAATSVKILDDTGKVVREYKINDLPKGEHAWKWDGRDEKAMDLGPGDYQVSVSAKNKQGGQVVAETGFSGIVTGVEFTKEGPYLKIGDSGIKLSEVKEIHNQGIVK